jgi:hypothetical protein
MDYKKIYDSLITKARNRTMPGYYEKHHVVPRCLGGDDCPANLVRLTPEEHFVAHQLLVKMYPNNSKLAFAAHLMTTHTTNHRVSNKLYGWLRRKLSEAMKRNYLENPSPEVQQGLFRGKSHSDESKELISKHTSIALRQKMAKDIFCFNMQGVFLRKFTNLVEAAEFAETAPSNIKYCAEGKFKHIKGYLWSYTNVCPEIPKSMRTKNRKVHTPDGIFDSVTDVMKYYKISSSNLVRHRCKSMDSKYEKWYYVDGPELKGKE